MRIKKSTNLLDWVTVLVSEVFVLAVVSVELRRTKKKLFRKICRVSVYGLYYGLRFWIANW